LKVKREEKGVGDNKGHNGNSVSSRRRVIALVFETTHVGSRRMYEGSVFGGICSKEEHI
jgi:hypothetical protein